VRKQHEKVSEIFDQDSKVFNLSKLRVTDIPTNVRVHEPRAGSGPNEMKIQVQRDEMLRAGNKFIRAECNEKGEIVQTNLTKEEIIGKKRLRKRIKKSKIVVVTTDKSGKLAVSTPEIYKEAAKVHLEKI
jgi:hypothetical protein